MTTCYVGAQRPVHLRLPAGAATSEGRDAVELAAIAGLTLDDWQAWFLETSLHKRPDGKWAAFEVGLIVPRQNGKGALLEARQLAGLFLLDEPLQVHTAHEFKTAYEHFLRIVGLVEGCPDLDRKVMRVRRGAGEQAIELKDGSRLRFLARTTGSGRGMSGDAVYLDESFALTTTMMGALLPTLSAVPDPQMWYTSSAPMETSTVLHSLRARGRSEGDGRFFYAEWGLEPDADIDDPANWALANPALGIRISEDFVRSELDAMRSMPDEFARERLGVAQGGVDAASLVPHWSELVDADSIIVRDRHIALDVAPLGKSAALGWAGRRADGLLHVEDLWHAPGTTWVLERCSRLWQNYRLPIRIQTGSTAASFINLLRAEGIGVVEVSPGEYGQAVGQFLGACEQPARLRHLGRLSLDNAVRRAEVRQSGDVDVWARRTAAVDITPLVAVTLALGGVPNDPPSGGLFVAVT